MQRADGMRTHSIYTDSYRTLLSLLVLSPTIHYLSHTPTTTTLHSHPQPQSRTTTTTVSSSHGGVQSVAGVHECVIGAQELFHHAHVLAKPVRRRGAEVGTTARAPK
jgi:hypothetical protein